MKYRIVVTNTFDRGMRRLMLNDRQRARQLIKEIQANPYVFKELGGKLKGLRSARFGDYRIIFAIDRKQKAVVLFFKTEGKSLWIALVYDCLFYSLTLNI